MASRNDLLESLGRTGYAVKGIVYALLGFVALDAALTPSSPEGSSGLFRWISGGPFGSIILGALALGLLAYALWRVALATIGPENAGDKEWETRVYYIISGLAYGFLAYQAGRYLFGSSGGGGGGAKRGADRDASLPAFRPCDRGRAGGGPCSGYALHQFYRAYKTTFTKKLDLSSLSPSAREWAIRAARAGLAARGVVYVLVAGFFASAAWQASSSESGGLEQALVTLKQQPFGNILLGAVALGLIGYGVYCGLNARYRHYG